MEIIVWILIGLLTVLELSRLAAALAGPALPSRVLGSWDKDLTAERLIDLLSAALDTPVHRATRAEIHVDGHASYRAQLQAIRDARHSIHLCAYIFKPSPIAERFIEALAERAAAGVEVRVLLDAFGSFRMPRRRFDAVTRAGGRLCFYHAIRWNTWPHMNHRNHQNLLILDGRSAFMGGAGVDEYWDRGRGGHPPWRDSVFFFSGGAVAGLQAAFAENWLATTGELLGRESDFPLPFNNEGVTAMTVNSSPTQGGATRARVLFRHLIHNARERIHIATPYFLPNASARQELVRAMRERGVQVDVLVPGRHSVPFFTRRCSRRHYGELLRAGARIHEYDLAMMHAKTMVVDGLWSVVGSTNFDPRSFGINDEINTVVVDRDFATDLESSFQVDLRHSHSITYDEWKKRPRWERATELLSAVFEQQQ